MSWLYLFIKQQQQQQPFYGHLVQDSPAELMLLQRKVLLEQTLDSCHSTYSVKALQENPPTK